MLRDERVGLEAGQLKAEGCRATKIAEKAGISRVSVYRALATP
jgi:DNA-binding phage protein